MLILETRFNDFESGSFSETTVIKGKAKFMIGGTEGLTRTDEAVMASYFWEVDLNTSFTGEDNLNVEIETGNTPDTTSFLSVTDFGKDFGDALKVSNINSLLLTVSN